MDYTISLYAIPLHLQNRFSNVLKETSKDIDLTIYTDTIISVLAEDDVSNYNLANTLRNLISSFTENKKHELAILSYNTYTMLLVYEICKYRNLNIKLSRPNFFKDEQGNIVFKEIELPKENAARLVFREDVITGLKYLNMLREINTGKV